MKYIDADKLKADIRRIVEEETPISKGSDYYHGVADTADKLLSFIASLQQEQPEVDLENYISNKLRELGADLINHMPYSFNRGLNVGKTNAYNDILDKLNARKEESK